MFRRTASITLATIASLGLITAAALGATLTLDREPRAQLEDIQVFPEAPTSTHRATFPHIEPEQPAPPLTLAEQTQSAPASVSGTVRSAPKSPTTSRPEPAETTTTPTEAIETTTVSEDPETESVVPSEPDPVEVVLPPVVEDPATPDPDDDNTEVTDPPVEDKPSKDDKPEKPSKGDKRDNDREGRKPWQDIIDDWRDEINEGDWDVEVDWSDDGDSDDGDSDDHDDDDDDD